MAYLRGKQEKFEIDYPLEKIWSAIPQVIETLQWTIQEKDDAVHTAKIKSRAGFLAYSTIIIVEAKAIDEKTTRMVVTGETPVTTITSVLDFGRTDDRIGQFIRTLAKLMEGKNANPSSD